MKIPQAVRLSFTVVGLTTCAMLAASIAGYWYDQVPGGQYAPLACIALFGLLGYCFSSSRPAHKLEPANGISQSLQGAFNALAEGVLVLDNDERIVLANQAFANSSRRPITQLIGQKASDLGWLDPRLDPARESVLPWLGVLADREARHNVRLQSGTGNDLRRYRISCTPIFDAYEQPQGVLATFDDLTEIERDHDQLVQALTRLEDTQGVIDRQNDKLRFLAECDPLSGCMNRRTFGQTGTALFKHAFSSARELCCLMVDIDDFKSINENYGHEVGDNVIVLVAGILKSSLREEDILARWGSKEFCILLPDTNDAMAVVTAERIRTAIGRDLLDRFAQDLVITVSIGISAECDHVDSLSGLINKADIALHAAKRGGHNRVERWSMTSVNEDSTGDSDIGSDDDKNRELLGVRLLELEKDNELKTQQLERAAKYDELTGLPNRNLFLDTLDMLMQRARRDSACIAVFSISTQVYKRISDTMGYDMAARLMSTVGECLQSVVRSSDVVAMIGRDTDSPLLYRVDGDEFGVVIPELKSESSVAWIVKRLIDAFEEPIQVNNFSLHVFIKVGISVYPNDAQTPLEITRNASNARYSCDRDAVSSEFHFYDGSLNKMAAAQIQMESDLIKALKNNEFRLHYQPRYDTRSETICAYEALARWVHPERGMVPAYEFIEVAERSGLMPLLGKWVIEEALSQAATWWRLGHTDCTMCVNISPMQLREPGVVEHIFETAKRFDFPLDRLELEITETILIDHIDYTAHLLHRLREAGIRIALDDFGVGYSSLSYLKSLEVDTLKIDRCFVKDLENDGDDTSIIAAIISMARSFNIRTVGEGVESNTQVQIMRDLHCDELQGFYLSKPVPAEDIEVLLEIQRDNSAGEKTA